MNQERHRSANHEKRRFTFANHWDLNLIEDEDEEEDELWFLEKCKRAAWSINRVMVSDVREPGTFVK